MVRGQIKNWSRIKSNYNGFGGFNTIENPRISAFQQEQNHQNILI